MTTVAVRRRWRRIRRIFWATVWIVIAWFVALIVLELVNGDI